MAVLSVPETYAPVGVHRRAVEESKAIMQNPKAKLSAVTGHSASQHAQEKIQKGVCFVTSIHNVALLGVEMEIQLPTLTCPTVRDVVHATVQKGVGIVTGLNECVVGTADHIHEVASEKLSQTMTGGGIALAKSSVSKVRVACKKVKARGANAWARNARHAGSSRAHIAAGGAGSKARKIASAAHKMTKSKTFRTTAASGAGAAMALGTTGGVAGLATGTVVGAAVGLVPALFTLGLSIPLGAAVGGTCGLVTGAAAGGAVGVVGGSVAGYGACEKRDQIASIAAKTMTSVTVSAGKAKDNATASADYIKHGASAMRSLFVSGGFRSEGDR